MLAAAFDALYREHPACDQLALQFRYQYSLKTAEPAQLKRQDFHVLQLINATGAGCVLCNLLSHVSRTGNAVQQLVQNALSGVLLPALVSLVQSYIPGLCSGSASCRLSDCLLAADRKSVV